MRTMVVKKPIKHEKKHTYQHAIGRKVLNLKWQKNKNKKNMWTQDDINDVIWLNAQKKKQMTQERYNN